MRAQPPTLLTASIATDTDQGHGPVLATIPTLGTESAETVNSPDIFSGAPSDNYFNALAGNTLVAPPAAASRINSQENSHIDLWALLIVAAVAAFLSELFQRKQRK